jgi:hypothetical protein
MKPDRDTVRELLARYELSENMRKAVRARYGID